MLQSFSVPLDGPDALADGKLCPPRMLSAALPSCTAELTISGAPCEVRSEKGITLFSDQAGARYLCVHERGAGELPVLMALPRDIGRASDVILHPDGSVTARFQIAGEQQLYRAATTQAAFEPWEPEGAVQCQNPTVHPDGSVTAVFEIDGAQHLYRASNMQAPFQPWGPEGANWCYNPTLHADGSVTAIFEIDQELHLYRAANMQVAFEPWGPEGATGCSAYALHPDGSVTAIFEIDGLHLYRAANTHAAFEPWEPDGATRCNNPTLHPDGTVTAIFQINGALQRHLYRAANTQAPFQRWEPDGATRCNNPTLHPDGTVTAIFQINGALQRRLYRAANMQAAFEPWGPDEATECDGHTLNPDGSVTAMFEINGAEHLYRAECSGAAFDRMPENLIGDILWVNRYGNDGRELFATSEGLFLLGPPSDDSPRSVNRLGSYLGEGDQGRFHTFSLPGDSTTPQSVALLYKNQIHVLGRNAALVFAAVVSRDGHTTDLLVYNPATSAVTVEVLDNN